MFSNMFATVRFTMLPLVFYFYCRISTMGSLQTKNGKQKPHPILLTAVKVIYNKSLVSDLVNNFNSAVR